jgi:hypothetical protein
MLNNAELVNLASNISKSDAQSASAVVASASAAPPPTLVSSGEIV